MATHHRSPSPTQVSARVSAIHELSTTIARLLTTVLTRNTMPHSRAAKGDVFPCAWVFMQAEPMRPMHPGAHVKQEAAQMDDTAPMQVGQDMVYTYVSMHVFACVGTCMCLFGRVCSCVCACHCFCHQVSPRQAVCVYVMQAGDITQCSPRTLLRCTCQCLCARVSVCVRVLVACRQNPCNLRRRSLPTR